MKQLILAAFVFLSVPLAYSQEADKQQPDSQMVYKTLGDIELKLDLFNPEGHKPSDKRPAIIFFFGGGWTSGAPSQFHPQAAHLASRGIVAICADYRVKSRHDTTPVECVKDGKSAVRWVRQHAEELGIDPKKILAGGGSAGGHVAAATAFTGFEEQGEDLKVSSQPAALVLFNPVYDNGPKGYGHKRVKDYWQKISPMHNIGKTTPPTIVFFGSKDKFVSVSTAEKYKQLMEKSGRRCDLHIYKDQPHGFFNNKKKQYFKKTVDEMDKFLVSLGYLKEKK